MAGRIRLAPTHPRGAGQGTEAAGDKPDAIDDDDVQRWMDEFGY